MFGAELMTLSHARARGQGWQRHGEDAWRGPRGRCQSHGHTYLHRSPAGFEHAADVRVRRRWPSTPECWALWGLASSAERRDVRVRDAPRRVKSRAPCNPPTLTLPALRPPPTSLGRLRMHAANDVAVVDHALRDVAETFRTPHHLTRCHQHITQQTLV